MFALLLRQGIRRRPLLVKLQSRWSSKYESNKTDMTSDVKVKELLSSLSIEERRLLYERLRQVLIDEEMALASASSKPKGKVSSGRGVVGRCLSPIIHSHYSELHYHLCPPLSWPPSSLVQVLLR